jgi:hypothetical protein
MNKKIFLFAASLFIALFVLPQVSLAVPGVDADDYYEWLEFEKEVSAESEVLGVSTAPSCLFLNANLPIKMNQENDVLEVALVQYFLKTYQSESSLLISGKYDAQTAAAVNRFQEKHASEILTPWGYDRGTGVVYTLTQAKMNQIVCGTPMDDSLSAIQKAEVIAYKKGNNQSVALAILNPAQSNITFEGVGEILAEISSTSTDIAFMPRTEADNIAFNNIENQDQDKDTLGILSVFNSDSGRINKLSAAVFTIPQGPLALLSLAFFITLLVAFYSFSQIFSWQNELVFLVGFLVSISLVLLAGTSFLVPPLFLAFVVSFIFFQRAEAIKN